MAKYLMIWELNLALIPKDPKERGAGYELLLGMVKQDIEKGVLKDWGSFTGESSGYSVVEGTKVEIGKFVPLWQGSSFSYPPFGHRSHGPRYRQ